MECTSEKNASSREALFEKLYETAFPRVARMVKNRGGQLEDAQDIFQEAVICYYERTVAGKLDIRTSPATYITGIARHLWLRQCQKNRYTAISEIPPPLDLIQSEDEKQPGRKERLLRYLESAGRRCMDLLQAFYYQRLSMQEIAEEFGFKGKRSATVQKYKCLEKVRKTVREEEPTEELINS